MEISRLTKYDERALADLDKLMQALASNGVSCSQVGTVWNGLEKVGNVRGGEARLKETLNDGNSFLFVAKDETAGIVGCGTLCVMHTPELRIGAVEAVVVLPEFRGRGIGKGIMEAILAKAKELKLDRIHLTSNPRREAANKLYQSLGFQLKQTNNYILTIDSTIGI